MAEYIEKNALYKKIAELEELARNRYLDTPSNSPACARYMAQLDERTRFKHMIYDSPAADVAEVKHGKWIEYPRAHYFKCSECKETVPYKKAVLIRGKRKYKYCPHCGAKMGAEG